jgi:hypothetical protein
MKLTLATLLLIALSSSTIAEAKRNGQNLLKKVTGQGNTKNCNRRKCDFDTSGIDIDTADEIELVGVGSGNRTFKCSRYDFLGIGKVEGWYVPWLIVF